MRRKTRITFLLFLLTMEILLFFYIQTSIVKLNSWSTLRYNISSTTKPTTNSQRTRVIIVAHGRSGSSFLAAIFNSHPDFFFIFEPLNMVQRLVDRLSKDYLYKAEHVVNSILNCNFTDDAFLQELSRYSIHRASSRPLVSPPFCKTQYKRASDFLSRANWKLCGNATILASVLNELCGKHRHIATKILLERIEPADLTWLVDNNGSSSVNYVLYLVRDPRAMLHSRSRMGWVVPNERFKQGLENGEVDDEVRKVCDTMELNLGAVLLEPQNIKLIRYEELAANPEAIVRDLFNELRISTSTDVLQWIHNKTHVHGPVKISPLSLMRQANVSINGWRAKIDRQYLQIIETRCARVLKYLGYIPTQGSQGILHNLSRPLYLKKMRDLKETYQWLAL